MTQAALAFLLATVLANGVVAAAERGEPGAAQSREEAPYRTSGEDPLDFRGPGRDAVEPVVDEVVLGWFGPAEPDHAEHGELWRGATLALDEENAAGGYHGKPFRLESAWSESPWQAGVVGVTRLVYQRGAWAVIGGVDGTTTHLAVQLALKSYFLLLSPGSTDVSADDANVPWLFSLPPSDDRIAAVLADAIASGAGPFVILAAADHDSHAALGALRRALAPSQLAPAAVLELPGEAAARELAVAAVLRAQHPRTLVVLGGAQASASIVRASRTAGFAGPVLGGPALGRAAFARAAGTAAARTQAPAWIDTRSPRWRSFASAYAARWHAEPDWSAACGYDAVRLVVAAVRRAGLNRPRIRDALRALAPYDGVSGVVRWNARGRNEPGLRLEAR